MLITVGDKKNSHWNLTDDCIEVFDCKLGFLNKPHLTQKIFLKDIQEIRICWKNIMLGRVLKYAHPVYMKIFQKNKDAIFVELNTDTSRTNVLSALDSLKEKVHLVDKYNVISALKNPDQNLWEYIEDVIKEHDLGYSLYVKSDK